MLKKIIAVAIAVAASNASALPFIDFTGIAAGAQVLDYYNGGTDSNGASGTNYGVRFHGGTIVYDEFGPRIEGQFAMSFAPDIVPINEYGYFNISFLAVTYGDTGSYSSGVYTTRTDSPYCSNLTRQQCLDIGHTPFSPQNLDSYRYNSDGTAPSIGFNTNAVDDIQFGGPFVFRQRKISEFYSEVPEPGSIALFGISALGLLASRRRKTKQLAQLACGKLPV